jgi:hypothetical protein
MADGDSKTWTVLKGIGGVAGAVVTGVLIYHLTNPTPAPAPPQVGLNGFVSDAASQQPIPNAMVTVDVGPKVATQSTDTEGRFSFAMDGAESAPVSASESASVEVLADGYEHYQTTVAVQPGLNFAELTVPRIEVKVAAMPDAMHPGAAVVVPAEHAAPRAAVILKAPLNYTARSDRAVLTAKK